MNCKVCNESIDSTAFGLNKKLLGRGVTEFYCVNCLAKKLSCTAKDLYLKAESLKKSGCCFFPDAKNEN